MVKQKGKGRKKQRKGPTPLGTAILLPAAMGLGAEDETLQGMAEYRRKDETELVIPEQNIATELNDNSAINARRCYLLSWLLPDPSNDRGALLGLEHFDLRIENAGIFDLSLVVQQPFGHETCPSSLAAWVLVANTTLKSGSTVNFRIRPMDNNLVVPYRLDLNGADGVGFAAVSAARQAMSSGGTEVSKKEVGLRMTVKAFYKASGNALQGGKFFALRTLSDDTIMSRVESKPPVPLAVRDVAPGCMKMTWAKQSAVLAPVFWTAGGLLGNNQLPGLSQSHQYRLPVPVRGLNATGLYLKTFETSEADVKKRTKFWAVVSSPFDVQAVPHDEKVALPSLGDYTSDCLLTPVPKYKYFDKLEGLQTARGNVVRASVGPRMVEATQWKDDFLQAVSFIVSVIKVAAAVAGAAGLLNVVEDGELGFVSC